MYFEVSLHPNNDIIVSTVCIESRLGPLCRRQYETRGIVVLWYRCVVAAWRRCIVASQHPRSCCCCSTRAASCCVTVVCKWCCTGRISLSGGCWIKRSMVNGVERLYGQIETGNSNARILQLLAFIHLVCLVYVVHLVATVCFFKADGNVAAMLCGAAFAMLCGAAFAMLCGAAFAMPSHRTTSRQYRGRVKRIERRTRHSLP